MVTLDVDNEDDEMKDHTELEVWVRSIDLAAQVYKITDTFPRSETFGLCTQMRRAAVSVASNIAEGAARRTTKDLMAFLHVSRGSLAELETQMVIAQRIGLLFDCSEVTSQARVVGKLLNGLLRALRQKVRAET